MIDIALVDAANNCAREGAKATVTLKSGVQITGRLDRPRNGERGTGHVYTEGGGWATFRIDEVAMVASHR
jgi:hypothetical protein